MMVLLTWLAVPIFNLLLRLDRFGRLVLSREQIVSVHSLNYSHFDPSTQKYLPDYAAMIVYER